jgi:hypothetical protein
MKRRITAAPAWWITLAATLDLVALVFMSSSKPRAGTLTAFAACEVVLIVGAVAAWKKYFEDLIDEKTKRD